MIELLMRTGLPEEILIPILLYEHAVNPRIGIGGEQYLIILPMEGEPTVIHVGSGRELSGKERNKLLTMYEALTRGESRPLLEFPVLLTELLSRCRFGMYRTSNCLALVGSLPLEGKVKFRNMPVREVVLIVIPPLSSPYLP